MSAAEVRRLWRNTVVRALGVPLVVLVPLVALAPSADQRFNVYWHGGLFRDDPLGVFRHSFVTMTGISNGNYRPLGRSLEKLLDLAAYLLTDQFGVSVTVATRAVAFAAAAVFTLTTVLFVEAVVARGRMFAGPPSAAAGVLPFAVGAGLVAAGGASTTVLYTGLYLLSASVVFGVAALACRLTTAGGRRPGVGVVVTAVPMGAALAVFNEMAYLALPLAVVAVLVRGRVVLDLPWRVLRRTAGACLVVLLWVGFLPVFVPIRVAIWRYCRDGDCYRGSDVAVGPDVLVALPVRMVAWLPPLQWQAATRDPDGSWLLVLAVLAAHTVRDLGGLRPLDRRQALGLAGAAFTVLLLASALAALNADIQQFARQGRWQGWRDSGLTTVGG